MKVRIKFAKTGALVYIGHLDVMRYFQKLFRRAGIPVAYSEGFSPHQLLTFSHPLPLGMESEGEYVDAQMTRPINSEEAIRLLNEQSVPEIQVLSFKELPEKCENAMAQVKAARYLVSFAKECVNCDLNDCIDTLLQKDEIVVHKITKKSEKDEDIKPHIFEIKAVGEGNDCLEMLISSGSLYNLKPELVINAMARENNLVIEETDIRIKRIEQYTVKDDIFLSLDEIGTEVR